jgi:hypothetical protein
MPNTLLTIGGITKRAIALFMNSNAFLMNVNRQYDSQFAVEGYKIGSSLRVRLPNDYTVQTGPGISAGQATTEQYTTINITRQATVPMQFTSQDLSLSMDDFSDRVLKPAINVMAGDVAKNIMAMADDVPNLVFKDSSGIVKPDISTWLLAGAKLDNISAPSVGRKVVMSPITQARTVATFSGFFNPTGRISDQYETGEVTQALNYRWMSDQTTKLHTTGAFSAEPTVNGASQTGSAITINATTGAAYNVGDIVTFAGVYAVNRVTKESTGELAQFVVTAAVNGSSTTINIYPSLIPASSGAAVQYQTVDASPADNAQISCATAASAQYRKNFVFLPEAFTLVTADLPMMNKGVIDCARENFDGISMRMVQGYQILDDIQITRLDMLYGWKSIRPEWACLVADIV